MIKANLGRYSKTGALPRDILNLSEKEKVVIAWNTSAQAVLVFNLRIKGNIRINPSPNPSGCQTLPGSLVLFYFNIQR